MIVPLKTGLADLTNTPPPPDEQTEEELFQEKQVLLGALGGFVSGAYKAASAFHELRFDDDVLGRWVIDDRTVAFSIPTHSLSFPPPTIVIL